MTPKTHQHVLSDVAEGQHALPAAVRGRQRGGTSLASRLDGLDLHTPALLTRGPNFRLLFDGGRKGTCLPYQQERIGKECG